MSLNFTSTLLLPLSHLQSESRGIAIFLHSAHHLLFIHWENLRCGTNIQWNITQHEKEWYWVICRDVSGPRDSCRAMEVRKRKSNTVYYGIYVKFRKMVQLQGRNRVTDIENGCVDRERGMGAGVNGENGTDLYTLLYVKWIANGNLLYRTGNSAQCSMIT